MNPFSKKIKPIIIGVCGRSCSGKSTIVQELEQRYAGEVLQISQDKFFKIKPDNMETPESLRFDKLIEAIKLLKEGKKAFMPTHRWTENFDRELTPTKIIIVEGFLLFINNDLNKLFDKKIWVDVSDVNLLYRRTKRDNTSKNIDYTMNQVIPASKKYEKVQKDEADIVIDGNKSKEEITQQFEELIGSKESFVNSLNKYQNMLLGIGIGDAFGAGYEMKSRSEILKHIKLNKYVRKDETKKGKYTDDTQMSIAVIELLLSKERFTKENLAKKFVEVYHRDPHSGYSTATKTALVNSRSGKDFIKKVNQNSIRNGACMRSAPIGLISNIKKVIEYATINAEATHNTPKGITSSVCVALASHYFYYNLGKPEKIFDFCINSYPEMDRESLNYFNQLKKMKYFDSKIIFGKEHEKFGVPCDGMLTTGAVFYILSKFSESANQTLKESVLLGGDVDSVASIALGIVAIHQGLKEIPTSLLYGLENGKYGRNYLIELGEKLSKNGTLLN